MNIALFGATGGTGRPFLEQALAAGHSVKAQARTPSKLDITHPNLHVIQGDVLDADSVRDVVEGTDAVVSALGVNKLGKSTVLSDGTKTILEAMRRHGVTRSVWVTSMGVGDSQAPSKLFAYFVQPVVLRNVFADKERQETAIMVSKGDWTIVRPSGLTNDAKTGEYKVNFDPEKENMSGRIPRADVADFMLQVLEQNSHLKEAVTLSK